MSDHIPRDELLGFQEGYQLRAFELISDGEPSEDGSVTPLGEGGTGVVYKANQNLSDDISIERAIKFFVYRDDIAQLTEHEESDQISASHFKDELLNLTSIRHENVIKVVDVGFHEPNVTKDIQIPFIVTEFIDGPTLERAIIQDSFERSIQDDPQYLFDIILQLCEGVSYLHQRGFFHCDLAPKNIFLQGAFPNPWVVIGDLGLGCTFPLEGQESVFVAGTKSYMPERIRKHVNSRVERDVFESFQPNWDVYALIKTIHEVLLSLRDDPVVRRPWQGALRKRLQRGLDDGTIESIGELSEVVRWLRPAERSVAQLPELTGASPGNKSTLMPVEPVVTSYRLRRLSEHSSLQRLKRVPQLVMATAVFPGASHSRYEHSLGIYSAMRAYMLSLLDDREFLSMFNRSSVELALVAGLLSNIARFPFSTIIHELKLVHHDWFEEISRESLLDELLFEWEDDRFDGASLAELIAEHFPRVGIESLRWILADAVGGGEGEVSRLIHTLLNCSIDARVLDFLRRDALHLGVAKEDVVDVVALLRHVRIREGKLVVSTRALPLLEQVITLRYWMFNRVYWNKPNRSLIAMLRHVLASLMVEDGGLGKRFRQKALRSTEEDLLLWLRQEADQLGRDALADVCDDLLQPYPVRFKQVYQVNRVEDDATAGRICTELANYSAIEMLEIERELNISLERELSLGSESLHALVDIPQEDRPKLGEDINLVTYKNDIVPLHQLSGIARGAHNSFREHLQRVRVFMNRREYKALSEKEMRRVRGCVEEILRSV